MMTGSLIKDIIITATLAAACAVALICNGCTSIEHISPDGSKTKYFRCGSQELDDVSLVLADGSGIDFKKQKSDPSETIKSLTELIKTIK